MYEILMAILIRVLYVLTCILFVYEMNKDNA